MIQFLNTWAKNLGLSIIIVSVLEMLLPNNKTKKYIKMMMGVYILFCILSPWLANKTALAKNLNELIENQTNNATVASGTTVNQSSMDARIQELYIQEMEKDIIKKLKAKGYEVSKCKVNATISNQEEETKITKIKININRKNRIRRFSEHRKRKS